MFVLYVGDVGEYLCHRARQDYPMAQLLTRDNADAFIQNPSEAAYASLGDFKDADLAYDVFSKAKEIVYCPPDEWEGGKILEHHTLELLFRIKHKTMIPIYDIAAGSNGPRVIFERPPPIFRFPVIVESGLVDQRRVETEQIWAVGCSYTHGVGVEPHQRYANLLGEKFNLPVSVLAHPGSSIEWAADQILRSDIRANDKVFWGVTTWGRMPYAIENGLVHVNAHPLILSRQKNNPKTKQVIQRTIDEIGTCNHIYRQVRVIQQVNNYCKKIGAKLCMMSLLNDVDRNYLYLDMRNFRPCWVSIDYGTDEYLHPGPLTHKFYAEEFARLYQDFYT